MYPPEMVAPMRQEAVDAGATELHTATAVDAAMSDTTGTAFYFINSVCGCAAGSARPGLTVALQGSVKPTRVYTAFAGVDGDAVQAVRSRLIGFPPSSPCMALFKDGDLVAMVERHHIQGMSGDQLGESLQGLFAEHCG